MALSEAPGTQSGADGNGVVAGKVEKLKRPVAPDMTERDKQMEKLAVEMERYAERIRQIKDVLQSRREMSRGASSEEQVVIRRISDIRAKFQAALKQKQAFRDELNRASASRDALRAQMRDLKDRVKYTTVDEIDVQIARLEEKLNHTSMTSREEEWSVEQVKNLARSRATVRTYQERLDKMQEDERLREELAAKMRAIDDKLDALRADEKAEKERLQEIRASREDDTTEDATLQAEKKECYEIIVKLREKRDEIRSEFNAKYDVFKKADIEYKAQQSAERRKRKEQRRLEAEQRQVERAAREAEYKVDRFDEKGLRCDQLLAYLGKFAVTSKQDKEQVAIEDVEAPGPGFKLLTKQGDALDGFFAGTGKKGKGKRQKGRKDKEDKTDDKKLIHTIDILQEFHRLQVTVPNTVSEIPKAMQELKERKEHYKEVKEKGGHDVESKPKAETSNAQAKNGQPEQDAEIGQGTNTTKESQDQTWERNQMDDEFPLLSSGNKKDEAIAEAEDGGEADADKDVPAEEPSDVVDEDDSSDMAEKVTEDQSQLPGPAEDQSQLVGPTEEQSHLPGPAEDEGHILDVAADETEENGNEMEENEEEDEDDSEDKEIDDA